MIETFDEILNIYGYRLINFYLNATGYVNGIYECISKFRQYSKPGETVIDFGSGIGLIAFLLSKTHKVICVEKDGQDGEQEVFLKDKNIQKSVYKAAGLRLSDDIGILYGNIFLHGVYEHIADRQKFLSRIVDGSRLYIFRLPQKTSYSERLMKAHGELFSVEDTLKELVSAGFAIEEVYCSDFMPWSIPPVQNFYNMLFPIINIIDKLLLRTYLRKYAHNINIICRKV